MALRVKREFSEGERKSLPLFPISVAAELLGTTDQTLRLYEKHGLINPSRRNKNRFYSENDIKWLKCLRDLIHDKKISIEGVKRLLDYAPCWEIMKCTADFRGKCTAFIDNTKPCWEINRMVCKSADDKICNDCVVYLSGIRKKRATSRP
ncbi:MAG: MerR family transcriptional regulator [Nitrospirae bacterium]|nr:MerR family transcriptional regulator [Nitrospirota bacterium]